MSDKNSDQQNQSNTNYNAGNYMLLDDASYQNMQNNLNINNGGAQNFMDNQDQFDDFLKPKLSQNNNQNASHPAFGQEISYQIIFQKEISFPQLKSELACNQGFNYNNAIANLIMNFKQYSSQQIIQCVNIMISRTYFSLRETPLLVKYVWTISRLIQQVSKLQTFSTLKYQRMMVNLLNRSSQFYQVIYSPSDFMPKFEIICKQNGTNHLYQIIQVIHCRVQQETSQNTTLNLTQILYSYINHLLCSKIISQILQNLEEIRNAKVPMVILLTKISKFQFDHMNIQKHEDTLLSIKENQLKELNKIDAENYSLCLLQICDIIQTNEKIIKYSQKYVYPLIFSLLSENSTIQRKLLGMKMLNEKVQQAKIRPNNHFVKWLKDSSLIERLLKDDTHVQILRKIPLLLRFLHENGQIDQEKIANIVEQGLIGHEELLKVVQSFIMCLKIEQLDNVFDIIQTHKDLQSHNLINLIYSITNSPQLAGVSRKKSKNKSPKKGDQLHQMQQFQEQQHHNPIYDKLVIKMFTFLIKVIENHHTLYMGTLNKLLSSQQKILMDYLPDQMLNLLRKNHISAVWLLQICLKMDLAKQKGQKTSKYQFISKLALQGLYEYLFAILVRQRFNKVIVQKISNVLVYLCRYYKPFQKHQTQFLWRVLGMRSRDQKQRQQFFNFIKEALRYDSLLTQDSVNYIYFQIFMKQHHSWYSLRVYDCLQMLFMRLNQDCKQISYLTTSQQYQIQNPDLIGLGKFWYIYFECQDIKVVKKCKQFLCKLIFYKSPVRKLLYQHYANTIMNNMENAVQDQIRRRGFQIIDRISQAKKQQILNHNHTPPAQLTLNIINSTKQAQPPIKMIIKTSETYTLARLRELIGSTINPPNQQIKLMTRGQDLAGQQMTLKDKNFQDGQTITVQNNYSHQKSQERQKILQQNYESLTQIFGMEFQQKLLKFLIQKMEGQSLQKIIETLTDDSRMINIQMQFQQKQFNKQSQQNIHDLPRFGNGSFGDINTNQNNQLQSHKTLGLQSLQKLDIQPIKPSVEEQDLLGLNTNLNKMQEQNMVSNNKKEEQIKQKELNSKDFIKILSQNVTFMNIIFNSTEKLNDPSYWNKIKKFPINQEIAYKIQKLTSQLKWKQLFNQESHNGTLSLIYHLYIISLQCRSSQERAVQLLKNRQGFTFFTQWLKQLIKNKGNIKLIDGLVSIITDFLLYKSQLLKKFDSYVKQPQPNLQLFSYLCTLELNSLSPQFDLSMVKGLIELLLSQKIQKEVAVSLIKYILCFMQNESTKRPMIQKKPLLQQEEDNPSDMQFQEQAIDYLFIKLSSENIFKLLLTYGEIAQFLFIFQFSYQKNLRRKLAQELLQKLTPYLDKKLSQQLQNCDQYLSYYSLYSFAMVRFNRFNQDQLIKIVDIMIEKMNNSNGQQLQGQLILMGTICELDQKKSENLSNKLTDLAIWLFSFLLFGLENPHKQIRNKNVRKAAYQTLLSIARFNQILKQLVIQSTLGNQIGTRKKDQDMIDFRNQQFIGIKNLGATCYINSLLQQIYHTRLPLLLLQQKQMMNQIQSSNKMDIQGSFEKQLQYLAPLKKLFAQLYKTNKNVVNARPFIQSFLFYGEAINPSIQQDSTQFLMCLMDTIQQQGYKHDLQTVFGGTLCNQITGLQQGQQFIKNNNQHFKTISIDIKGKKNLHQALAFFIKGQNLQNQNMYFSQQLGRKTRAMKRTFFDKMPNILIFTLKRFQFDYQNMIRYKLNDYFQFPLDLDMQKYTSLYLKHNQEQLNQFKYRLAGILVHSGMAESGHYYSYIKVGEKWFQFNDRIVSQFNIQANIKSQCFGASEGKNRNAYMLFYEKIDSNAHGVYLNQLSQDNKYIKKVNKDNLQFLKNRLTFDAGYIDFIKQLYKQQGGQILQEILNQLGVNKNNNANNNNNVHFDADDEMKPLIDINDFDANQALNTGFCEYDGRNQNNNYQHDDLFNSYGDKL